MGLVGQNSVIFVPTDVDARATLHDCYSLIVYYITVEGCERTVTNYKVLYLC